MNNNTNINLDTEKVIRVNDSIMGSGKTTWAINYMNSHPDRQWIYCSPFISELERIEKACPNLHFKDPAPIDGRKLTGFKDLISNQQNICITHRCFTLADEEVYDLLRYADYSLIIDEELQIIDEFNRYTDHEKQIKAADITMLIEKKFIEVDHLGKVTWLERSYSDTLYGDVEMMAEKNNLFCIDGKMFVWRFPPAIWQLFNDITILTYYFTGSMLQGYFDYYGYKYKKVSTIFDNGEYNLVDYDRTIELKKRQEFADLITIHGDNLKYDTTKSNFLSSNWCNRNSRSNPDLMKAIQKSMVNFINNKLHASADKIIWTCFKKHKTLFEGKGYKRYKKTDEEMVIEKEMAENDSNYKISYYNQCFLECNAKATNLYADKTVLMYILNLYPNPEIVKFFNLKNDANGNNNIQIDSMVFALSCFLQWTWRSAIRDNKPIDVFIPSDRIRNLFKAWLSGEI